MAAPRAISDQSEYGVGVQPAMLPQYGLPRCSQAQKPSEKNTA